MSLIFKKGNAEIEANLTPMIDVTFLLIVFFVLVSQIVEVESVSMELPEPESPVTVPMSEEQRAVINVVPAADGRASGYRLGGRTFPADARGATELSSRLAELFAANPRLAVNLRADRRTEYASVQPVLDAVTRAAARVPGVEVEPRVNLVVIRADS